MPTPSSPTDENDGVLTITDPCFNLSAEAQAAAVAHGAETVRRQIPDDLPDLVLVGLECNLGRGNLNLNDVTFQHFRAVPQQQRRIVEIRRTSSAAIENRCGRA